jgi:hypothetical protein
VGEDAVAAPGACAGKPVDSRSGEPEVAFGAADPSFAAGAPSHHLLEGASVLDLATCRSRSALGACGLVLLEGNGPMAEKDVTAAVVDMAGEAGWRT